MIVRKDYTLFLEDIGPNFLADVKEQEGNILIHIRNVL
jgi:hypothetical protein